MENAAHMADRAADRSEPELPLDDVAAEAEADEPEDEKPPTVDADLPPADPVTDAEMKAFLRDPKLNAGLLKVAKGRVDEDYVDDVLQEARLAIATSKKLPPEPKKRLQYALGIARNVAIEWHTRQKRRPDNEPLEAVPVGSGDDGGLRRANDAQVLEKIAASVPAKERPTWECLVRKLLWRESVADMAREMGVQESTLHKRVTALQGRLKTSGFALAALGAVLLFLVHNVWRPWDEGPLVGAPPPPDSTETQPDEPKEPTPGTPEAKARAAQLRAEAQAQCAAGQWKKCLWSYDRAYGLDTEDETPEVKAAHDRALEEVRKQER
jgi:DNA-directed RNA polymerase specialized sigma24 family protein